MWWSSGKSWGPRGKELPLSADGRETNCRALSAIRVLGLKNDLLLAELNYLSVAKAHPKMSVEMCFLCVGVRPPAGHGETIKGEIVLCLQGADGPVGERQRAGS